MAPPRHDTMPPPADFCLSAMPPFFIFTLYAMPLFAAPLPFSIATPLLAAAATSTFMQSENLRACAFTRQDARQTGIPYRIYCLLAPPSGNISFRRRCPFMHYTPPCERVRLPVYAASERRRRAARSAKDASVLRSSVMSAHSTCYSNHPSLPFCILPDSFSQPPRHVMLVFHAASVCRR